MNVYDLINFSSDSNNKEHMKMQLIVLA